MTQTRNSYSEILPRPTSGPSEKPKISRGRAKFMVVLVISASGETGLICHEPAETHRDHLPALRFTLESPVCIEPLPVFYPEKNTQTCSRWAYSSQPQPFQQVIDSTAGQMFVKLQYGRSQGRTPCQRSLSPIAFKIRECGIDLPTKSNSSQHV